MFDRFLCYMFHRFHFVLALLVWLFGIPPRFFKWDLDSTMRMRPASNCAWLDNISTRDVIRQRNDGRAARCDSHGEALLMNICLAPKGVSLASCNDASGMVKNNGFFPRACRVFGVTFAGSLPWETTKVGCKLSVLRGRGVMFFLRRRLELRVCPISNFYGFEQ